MKLKNCPQCGKVFADSNTHKLCPVCRQEEEDKFMKVKEFLWDNPRASIDEVHQQTGVERDLIIKFVREDRLIAEGLDLNLAIQCERCGTLISHGRYCEKCQHELVEGFSGGSVDKNRKQKTTKKESGKMYLKDRIKRYNQRD